MWSLRRTSGPLASLAGDSAASSASSVSPPAAANSGWRNFTEAHSSRCVLFFSSRTWPVAVLRSRPHDGGPDQPSETVADRIGPPASRARPSRSAPRQPVLPRPLRDAPAAPAPQPAAALPTGRRLCFAVRPGGPPPARMHGRPRLADGGASFLIPETSLYAASPALPRSRFREAGIAKIRIPSALIGRRWSALP
jgi:hypothetical protein